MVSTYDVSVQKTTIKVPAGTYVSHETTMSPIEQKGDKIEIGPNNYLPTLEYEPITVFYAALYPTMEVKYKREIFPTGLPVIIGAYENQLRKVHILDRFTFMNTDPAPIGLRENVLNIHKYK